MTTTQTRVYLVAPEDPEDPTARRPAATRLRTSVHSGEHGGGSNVPEGLQELARQLGAEVLGAQEREATRCFHVTTLYRVTTSAGPYPEPAMVRVSLGMHDAPDECGGRVELLHASGWVDLFSCPAVEWFYDMPTAGEEATLTALQDRADAYALEASGLL
jgi:hypothetical protein